jgi:nitric oxide reductase large subunit
MFAQKHWWKYLLGLFVMGACGVLFMGVQTYREAPPIPDFTAPDGTVVASSATILSGQAVFQKYALMEHGSLFGDGGYRGPDYTAESLHESARAMVAWHAASLPADAGPEARGAAEARARAEIKANHYDPATNRLHLAASQVAALSAVRELARALHAGRSRVVPPGGLHRRSARAVGPGRVLLLGRLGVRHAAARHAGELHAELALRPAGR